MSDLRCVICSKPILARPANRLFPFCSQRCRMVDLGKWMGEEYRVASREEEVEDELPSRGRGDGDDSEH